MNIFYLLNHKTLTDFEVPILTNSGFRCYIPKKYNSLSPVNSINYNTAHYYDNFININPTELSKMNKMDWFSEGEFDDSQIKFLHF